MRFTILAVLAAVLLSPIVGCESHSKTSESTNPITGTHTTQTDRSMSGN